MATIPNLPPGLVGKYEKQDNGLLYRRVRTDPRELLHVEIGDISDSQQFIPKVRHLAWGECGFGIRIPMLPGAKCEWSDNMLTYGNNNLTARFYEVADSSGFEYEVLFASKPNLNAWTFDLDMQDVVAWYQPALTPEELAERDSEGNPVHFAPDNVIGSYAIYKQSPFANRTGQTLYRCGKVGHLFRPRITDNNGNWTWCTLEIDPVLKKLLVTIPQAFYDNAQLPWLLDPEIGYHTAGGYTSSLETYITGQKGGAMTEDGTLTEIGVYSNPSSTSRTFAVGLYSDAATMNYIAGSADSGTLAATGAAWRTLALSAALTNGSSYQLCAWGSSGGGTHYISRDNVGTETNHWATASGYATWPSSVTRSGSTYHWSIYGTYTVAGATTHPGWAGGGCW